MIRYLTVGVKKAFGLLPPGRSLIIFPDDVILASYPKSGNTWSRFLIANLLYPEQHPNWGNIDRLIPAPEVMSKREFETGAETPHYPNARCVRSSLQASHQHCPRPA